MRSVGRVHATGAPPICTELTVSCDSRSSDSAVEPFDRLANVAVFVPWIV